ncbi:MAG: hypothetical protein CMF22_11775 [Idiomarinaceae bacterium]|nr:hypothetical protein [Idiomarinaceae bacterium]|tara:strand:+ start:43344 stop:43790 length:447 start_codon:yes stop_codon:yes gene_type:complete
MSIIDNIARRMPLIPPHIIGFMPMVLLLPMVIMMGIDASTIPMLIGMVFACVAALAIPVFERQYGAGAFARALKVPQGGSKWDIWIIIGMVLVAIGALNVAVGIISMFVPDIGFMFILSSLVGGVAEAVIGRSLINSVCSHKGNTFRL